MPDPTTTHADLTRGGHLRDAHISPVFAKTTNPPPVTRTTRIIAATHPGIHSAAHHIDGWFLADFYAFNYLLSGQGAQQQWFTVVPPKNVLEKHGNYVHGNSTQDRKVVLCESLLEERKITPVIIVRPNNIIDRFLAAIKTATEEAKKDGGSVLILLFCHGIDREHFGLDYTGRTKLTITMMRGVLEPYVPVCLMTTACFSGAWTVCPDINITTMTAANDKALSFSFPKIEDIQRYPGSVFIGSVIKALINTASDLLDGQEGALPDNGGGRPNCTAEPNPDMPEQVETYNALCRSIWECCEAMNCLWDHHRFTFSAQCDEWGAAWSDMTAMSPADYRAKWDALPSHPGGGSAQDRASSDPGPGDSRNQATGGQQLVAAAATGAIDNLSMGPLIESVSQRRMKEMIERWFKTCPGDDRQGYGTMLYALMRRCYDTGRPTDPDIFDIDDPALQWNVVAIIEYRLNMALIADSLLEDLDLPHPSGMSCLEYQEGFWHAEMRRKLNLSHDELDRQTSSIYDFLENSGMMKAMEPAAEQGPVFHRFRQYIVAAVFTAQLPEPKKSDVLAKIVDTIKKAAEFRTRTTRNDPKVKHRLKEWLKSLKQ